MISSTLESPQTAAPVDHNVNGLADRLLKLTLIINIVLPGFMFLAVYLLRALEVLPHTSFIPQETLQIIFYALLFVAVSEVAVVFVLKKAFFAPEKVRPALSDAGAFTKLVTGGSIALAALGAASMFYGVVLFVLGTDIAQVSLFALIALVHFRLFRPTADFLRSLIAQAS